MSLEMKQHLRMSQQLVMTPQLQQAIKLLQLSRMELESLIQEEMRENPVLEEPGEGEGDRPEDLPAIDRAEDVVAAPAEPAERIQEVKGEDQPNEIDWEAYLNNYQLTAPTAPSNKGMSEELPSFEQNLTRAESLQDHLLFQVRMGRFGEEECVVASFLIGHLDDDGYLKPEYIQGADKPPEGSSRPDDEELHFLMMVARECEVSLSVVDRTLRKLKRLDPPGVFARDLRECLLLQAHAMGEDDTLVGEIIRNHTKHLEQKNLPAMQKELNAARRKEADAERAAAEKERKEAWETARAASLDPEHFAPYEPLPEGAFPPNEVSLEAVIEAVKIIADMEPKPGRHFVTEDPQYITPDVYVHKVEKRREDGDEGPVEYDYVVVLNDDGLSKLRISEGYRAALKSGLAKQNGAKDYIQEKLRSAVWLIRSIHQRQRTIHKVTESIVKKQRDFLDHGIAHLKPLILKDVAEDIGMHESTVSRVTTAKYVHTPQGIFELKYFFNSGISKTGGEEVASEAVKDEIKKIVASEDSKNPYSDQKIVELLKERKIEIARRTVAKYREVLGILPSSRRKRYY